MSTEGQVTRAESLKIGLAIYHAFRRLRAISAAYGLQQFEAIERFGDPREWTHEHWAGLEQKMHERSRERWEKEFAKELGVEVGELP